MTMALTIPPLLMGLVAFAYVWPPALADRLAAQPADALPLIFRYVTPPIIGLLGLTLRVPQFIEQGEKIIVTTADGKYSSRA